MKDTRIKLPSGQVVLITNSQMWGIAMRVAWGLFWPMLVAAGVVLLVMRGCHLWE